VDDQRLVESLRSLPVPDAQGAQVRARDLVLAAHAGRRPVGRRRRRGVLALAAAVITGAVALSATQSPGVEHWVREALRTSAADPHAQPAGLAGLPGGGRLLVSTGLDAWVAGQGLTRPVTHTRGGAVSWSAFGNYIACGCGQTLEAVALSGRVVWTERFAARVGPPTWSTDGNRIAFTVGRELYVTAGDGTGARGLRPAPASGLFGLASWRPGPRHELAVRDAPRRVSLIDTDTGRLLARIPLESEPVSLGWSSDGRRLLATTRRTLRVYNVDARLVSRRQTSPGASITAAGISPSGRQIAYVVRGTNGRLETVLSAVERPRDNRVLLVGSALGGLLFSPDGRWLLVAWNELDSWMFFTTTTPTRARQITRVAAHFGSAEAVATAWCCVARPPAAGSG
jgi:hypothetical protein